MEQKKCRDVRGNSAVLHYWNHKLVIFMYLVLTMGFLIHVWPQHYFPLSLLMNNNTLKLDNDLSLGSSNIE